ncbi:hypothetical protein H5410_030270 [Solanum commersonii]|uniref:Uncharacterized protein n=1 Tax=Solanum commersonii TaxID=4109 RepID=A0A9J5YI59_SOLCO|nr:hypothetical protein H5410_030270 [Solanum commersonii]
MKIKEYIEDMMGGDELQDGIDLLEMNLISRNVRKQFLASSQSPERTLLTTPSKSYVADVVNKGASMVLISYQEDVMRPMIGKEHVVHLHSVADPGFEGYGCSLPLM